MRCKSMDWLVAFTLSFIISVVCLLFFDVILGFLFFLLAFFYFLQFFIVNGKVG